MQTIARSGEFQIAYTDQGEGLPLLLVPGVMMSARRWVEAGYVDVLSRHRRVLVIDPLGHGESTKTADVDAYAPQHLVEHLVAVLDAAGVESADVWGYSRGAFMAGELAEARPDRVRRLVAGGIPLFDRRALMEQLGMVPEASVIEARHQRCLAGEWAAFWEGFPLPLPEELKVDMASRNDLPSISACALATHRAPMNWQVPDGVETLAYWGSDEVFHDLNVEAVAGQSIQTATVPGGHAEAFFPSDPALATVVPFLQNE